MTTNPAPIDYIETDIDSCSTTHEGTLDQSITAVIFQCTGKVFSLTVLDRNTYPYEETFAYWEKIKKEDSNIEEMHFVYLSDKQISEVCKGDLMEFNNKLEAILKNK